MKLVEINENTYNEFLENSSLIAFQNTLSMSKVRKSSGWTSHFLGLYDDNSLLGIALLCSKSGKLGYKFFDCQYGPIIDYNDTDVVEFFFRELKMFLKRNKATKFSFNPNLVYNMYSSKGDVLNFKDTNLSENIFKNYSFSPKNLSDVLISLGYTKENFNVNVNGKWNMRWFFIKDLSNLTSESLLSSFNSQGKRSTKKSLSNNIIVQEAEYSEIKNVKKLLDISAEKQNFSTRDLCYYENLKTHFGDNIFLMIAEINIENYLTIIEKNILENEKKITSFLKKDKLQQVEDINKNQESLKKSQLKYENLLKISKEPTILLSSGVFIKTNSEMIYLFGGNDDKYQELCSSYALQYEMMKKSIELNIKKYNFYGVDSLGTKNDGVLKFKQGFDGNIVELIGTYHLILNKPKYKFITLMKQILKK